MNITTLLTNYWEDMVKPDATVMRKYFHSDAMIYLHDAKEKLSVDEFITEHCHYFDDTYKATVFRIDELKNGQFVTITFVGAKTWLDPKESPYTVSFETSFFTLNDDHKILESQKFSR